MNTHTVVIVGAGFGGLTCALELVEKAKYSDTPIAITVIDKSDYQLFTPDLYEIASASQLIESVQELKDAVCIDVRLAFRALGIRFIKSEVTAIDTKQKKITTTDSTLQYDSMVFALGSVSFDYGIPGIAEHAISFKTVDEAIEIRNRVMAHLDSGIKTHIAICGGGPAGVEVAAELAVAYKHAVHNKTLMISLVDAESRILGTFSPRVSKKATKRLKKIGVDVRTNFRITQATDDAVESLDSEKNTTQKINADIIVWTGGISSNPLTKEIGLTLNKRTQIVATEYLQSVDDASVFLIGDSAQIPVGTMEHPENHEKQKEPTVMYAPQTAHEAVEQGKLAAENIVSHINNKALKKYQALWTIYVITLGGKYGLIVLAKGIVISGFIGWFVRKFIDFRHFNAVLPFMRACSFWYNGMKTTLKND